jgi:4-diphosphocytidyl-2-C-methyl-D-erythritol kinase
MEIKAPAKLNIFLNVGKKREDGFHRIISLMTRIDLFDRMEITDSDTIEIEGMDNIPKEDNLIYKAAVRLRDYADIDKGCKITVDKIIPEGAGLGGGSSDAAAVLKGLNKFWGTGLERKELAGIGKVLGSDVNFFLYDGPCLVRGRGEQVEEIEDASPYGGSVVLIMPDIEISTRKVYENYPGGSLTEEKELNKIMENFREGNWPDVLRNDLQETVFKEFPILGSLYKRIINWGGYPLLSGSGASIFALTENDKTADSIAKIVEQNFNYTSTVVKPFTGV